MKVQRRKTVKLKRGNALKNNEGRGVMAANQDETKKSETPSAAANRGEMQPATIHYVDRLECAETFADSINHVYFDGQSLRIEFGITRIDDMKPNTPVTGRRYPAQRMVLTPMAAVELINRMQQVGAALTQAGLMKATPKPTTSGTPTR